MQGNPERGFRLEENKGVMDEDDLVKTAIETSLDADLPVSYDKDTFAAKTDLLLTHFIDMAVQGYGWVAA